MKYILKYTLPGLVAAFGLVALSPSANAQSNLQGSTNPVQPNTAQTQSTRSDLGQNQTGSVQQSGGADVLSQKTSGPLGVVSSPNQSAPDAVASASPNLSTAADTKTAKKSSSRTWEYLLGTVVAVMFITILLNSKNAQKNTRQSLQNQTEENIINPSALNELQSAQRSVKKKKKRSKKHRKTKQ